MEVLKLNDTTLKVTQVEGKTSSQNYIYEDLITHRAATVARKANEIASLDAEIAKTDLLIAEFKKLNMDIIPVKIEPKI